MALDGLARDLFNVFNKSTEDVIRTVDLTSYWRVELEEYLERPDGVLPRDLSRRTVFLLSRKDIILANSRVAYISPTFKLFLEETLSVFHASMVEASTLLRSGPLDDKLVERVRALSLKAQDMASLLYTGNDDYVKERSNGILEVLRVVFLVFIGIMGGLAASLGVMIHFWSKSLSQRTLLRELALRDPLTGLHNRRYFDEMCPQLIHSAERGAQVLGLISLDVDYFKLFNDTYGHDRGDEVLIAVAETLREGTGRSGDLAFRIGGEEFCCLVSTAKVIGVAHVAHRLRALVEKRAIPHRSNPQGGCLTISVGVATTRDLARPDPAALYALADKALYAAKKGGRNQVWVTGPDGEPARSEPV
jgi:diguanylate cyclase (GGDEF)-like protein